MTTRAFLVGVQTQDMREGEGDELLGELGDLVGSLGMDVAGRTLANLRRASPAFLIGSGKAAEIAALAGSEGAGVIVIDADLSPAQQRNWEAMAAGAAVIDRQEVILEVFADRAQTREARLQVALARLQYSLPRLTRAWSHLSRQRGRGTLGGEGETQLEQDRRLVRTRIARLKAELVEVVRQRGIQRRRRLRVPVPTAAIVGYTNAGKSSLLNALTGSHVLAEDKLFATLDPTTRQMELPGNRKLLLTDTVGFIRRLPHGLIEAFKATLEEVVVADFLIHVLDVTSSQMAKHRETTLGVLAEIGAAGQPVITVFNKVDAASAARLSEARRLEPGAIFVSAVTRQGLDGLVEACREFASEGAGAVELFIPHARYDAISRLHAVGQVYSEDYRDGGVALRARYPDSQAGFFESFVISPRLQT